MDVSGVGPGRLAEPLEEPPPEAMFRFGMVAKKRIARDASA
jgi:hypothetical protein